MEEADFPRGGASGLSGLEYRELTRKARKDALFEAGETATKPKKSAKKRRSEAGSAGNAKVKRRPSVKAPAKSIRPLTFKVRTSADPLSIVCLTPSLCLATTSASW